MIKKIKLSIVLSSLFLFLYGSLFYLYAQEKQEATKEVRQRREVIEKVLKEQEKALREERVRIKAGIKAQKIAEDKKKREEAKKAKEEEQARLKAEQERQRQEKEAQLKLGKERLAQEKEAKLKQLAEEKAKREEERQAQLQARQKEQSRLKAEREAREAELKTQREEEQVRLKAEQERQRQEKEAQLKLEKERLAKVAVSEPALETQEIQETQELQEEEYYIDVGDILSISVWQIPELSISEIIVRPDGKISFPLIGDIKAKGLTLTKLDDVVTEKLKAYVRNPEVSIMIKRFGEEGNKVIVLGEIAGPGVYKFSAPPTITEVVASAGGYGKYAVLNSIMVIRGYVKTKPEVIKVNLAQILKSGRLTENIFLKPNDIVYVPRSFIGNVNTFLEIFQPAISQYMQTLNLRQLQNALHRKS